VAMNLLSNTTKKKTKKGGTPVFKYLGIAEEKDCPNCGENAFFTYSFECLQTKKEIISCFACHQKKGQL